MDSTEHGTYVDLIKRFSQEYNKEFDILMESSERVEKLLMGGENDYCSLGFSVELAMAKGVPTSHLIQSVSFNRIYTSIISKKDNAINSIDELNAKTLVVFHVNMQDAKQQRIPKGFETTIVAVYELDSLIKVIVTGRVDAGFVTTPDIFLSPFYQRFMRKLHLVELPDSSRRESLVCIDSQSNRELIQLFDQYTDKLQKNKEINRYIDFQTSG